MRQCDSVSPVCLSVLSVSLSDTGPAARHVCFSVRVHTTLKTSTIRGESETGCISLVGMFVFVTPRPTREDALLE